MLLCVRDAGVLSERTHVLKLKSDFFNTIVNVLLYKGNRAVGAKFVTSRDAFSLDITRLVGIEGEGLKAAKNLSTLSS